MQRVIDKIKDSAPNSNTRSFSWLWEQFSDYLAELREDQNKRDFREAMMKETRLDPKTPKEKAKQTTAAAAKANAAPAVPPPMPKKKQPPNPPPAKQEGDGKGDEKARVQARAQERVKVRKRQGQRPKAPRASQVMEARQRPKQPSHASSTQKELAIVELTVVSAMKPLKLTQLRRVQVQQQRPLQRRQQQLHLSCLALRQPRRATPVVLVPQGVSLGLD